MHIIWLGVVRTIISSWVNVKNEKYSLPNHKIRRLSEKVCSLKDCITSDFARKPRDLTELSR